MTTLGEEVERLTKESFIKTMEEAIQEATNPMWHYYLQKGVWVYIYSRDRPFLFRLYARRNYIVIEKEYSEKFRARLTTKGGQTLVGARVDGFKMRFNQPENENAIEGKIVWMPAVTK